MAHRQRVDRDLLRSLAPILLEAGFNVQQATAIVSSIAAVVHATASEQDERIKEAISLVAQFGNLLKGMHDLNVERDKVAETAFEEIEKMEKAVAALRRRDDHD